MTKPDLVKLLRSWVHAVEAVSAADLMDEAADEIERLRLDARGYTNGVSAGAGSTTAHEIAPTATICVLTDAEREAVPAMACHCDTRAGLEWIRYAATLRGLLERTK